MATNQYLPQISRGIRNHTSYLFSFMVTKKYFHSRNITRAKGIFRAVYRLMIQA